GDHPAIGDRERLRSIAASGHIRGNLDPCLVEHAVADRYPVAVFLVEPLADAQIDETEGKARLFLRVDRPARRELKEPEAEFVDRRRSLIDDLIDRPGAGDGEERRRGTKRGALGVDPNAELLRLLAHQDRLGWPL